MKSKLRQITLYAAILSVATLFLKENFNSIALIGWTLLILITLITDRDYRPFSRKEFLLMSLPMVAYFILGLAGYAVNSESNGDYLMRLTPFLISPLFLYYFRKDRQSSRPVITAFIFSTLLFLLFLDFLAVRDMVRSGSLFVSHEGREYYRFLYTRFTLDYFNHIYLSAYILMAIALTLTFKPFENRYFSRTLILFFLFHLAILSSRAVIVSALIGGFMVLVYVSAINRKKAKYLILLMAFMLLGSGLVYTFRDTLLLNRYSQAFDLYDNQDRILTRNYSINNRIKLYIIGASLLEDHERYGINGTGLSYSVIRKKYNSRFSDEFPFETSTFNTHNQYINNFIDWGLAGLLLTCYLLFQPIRISFRSGNYWLAAFWISFAGILAMESFLIRHRGLVFFVIFYMLWASMASPEGRKTDRSPD